jgi:hypothetical protein
MVDKAKRGIEMIAAVSEALKFRKANPSADEEKIMRHVMSFLSEARSKEAKISSIAAVNYALKMLRQNPKHTERAIIDEIVTNIDSIKVE